MKVTLILTCAGKGVRADFDKNKLLVPFGGKTCLERSLAAVKECGLIDECVITSSKEDYTAVCELSAGFAKVVFGGETRTQSVKNALACIKDGIVLIHDGARPFLSKKIISDCIDDVKKYGSSVTAVPLRDTILKCSDGNFSEYVGKEGLCSVQTPQGFFAEEIKAAYLKAGDRIFPDDGSVYAEFVKAPHITQGSFENIKLTYKEDFEKLSSPRAFRTGVGFDCHRLTENRPLILGGVTIPHSKGLSGHSDADVLTHAIMDAILTAAAERDIGYHFSDKSPEFKNISSMILLSRVLKIIAAKGYKIESVSATVMAEKPKLSAYIPKIASNLANALGIDFSSVGIAATTLEGLGFVGREEGVCASASAVIVSI